MSYVNRMFQHSSSLSCGRFFKQEVLNRMKHAGIDQSLIDEIDSRTARTFRCVVPCNSSIPRPKRCKSFWIPLPFHHVYSGAVSKALHRFSNDQSIQELCQVSFGECIKFGAAWKIDSLPSVSIVRKH